MKKFILILTTSLLLLSCDVFDKQTNAELISANPMEDYAWLKVMKTTMTNCSCEISIIQGTYNRRTVFFIALTDILCDGIDMPTLYDSNGKAVRTFTSTDYREFYDHVTRDKVLYRCKTVQ
jgi:hypothetical protein